MGERRLFGLAKSALEVTAVVLFEAGEIFRRNTDYRLFSLVGIAKGELAQEEFAIAYRKVITPKHNAEFCAYANDLSFMYGNNSGALKLTITRTK